LVKIYSDKKVVLQTGKAQGAPACPLMIGHAKLAIA
jgi:hypothetical protein